MRRVPGEKLTAPTSRHNLHVTDRTDLREAGSWSRGTLFAAVQHADGTDEPDDAVVVLDYGRERLYVAARSGLAYDPPRALGVGRPPVLHVWEPSVFADGRATDGPDGGVAVSPRFDLLVPAFDREDQDAGEELPPVRSDRSREPVGRPTGASG